MRTLDAEVVKLRAKVEELTRAGKRQAAPFSKKAPTRLAELLAQTRRLERACELLEEGLARPGVGEATRGEWRALILRWCEGDLLDTTGVRFDGARLRALGPVPTARLDAHRSGSGNQWPPAP